MIHVFSKICQNIFFEVDRKGGTEDHCCHVTHLMFSLLKTKSSMK